METLWQDVRFALRTMARSPGFTAVAIVSLALGVGANTTIFTILNALLLTPLPVERPSELVAIYTTDSTTPSLFGGLTQMSYPNLKDFREQNTTLSAVAGYTFPNPVSVATGGEPQQAFAELVTGNYFDALGVKAARGRTFLRDEDTARGAHPVVVLAYGFWQRRLGGDQGIVGRTITVNGTPFTVVGIAPEGFIGVNSLFSPDMWAPSMMYDAVLPQQFRTWIDNRRALLFTAAGRLKPGVTAAQAEANLKSIAGALEREYPLPNRGRSVTLRPLAEATIFAGFRQAFVLGGAVLMTVVGLVLLIACSNVANLLMARSAGRRQEIAVRIALGAGRRRLVRQLLTESMLMAAFAGVLGLALAVAGRDAIWSMRPPFLALNFVDLTLDWRVLAFTATVSVFTPILFGLLPSLQASRPDVVSSLKEETRSAGPSRRRLAIGNLLVVVQVALSVVALVAAGLFLRSLEHANAIDPGFDVDHVALVGVNPGQAGYDIARSRQFYRDVQQRLASAAGIQSSAWASTAPLAGSFFLTIIREGDDPAANAARTLAVATVTSPGYFRTLSIPLVRGRDFTDADRTDAVPVAIVNTTFADRLWPGQDPIGKRFRFYTETFFRQVVGVARTVKYNTIGEDPQVAAYMPHEQAPSDTMVLLVRSAGSPATALGAAAGEIRTMDAHVPLTNPFTMRAVLSQSLWPARMAAILLGVLGGLALVLASVGLYGLMSYSVSQRTREIGVRMALGAKRTDVVAMVVRQAMTLVAAGLILGLGGAFAVSRVVSGLLFGLSATDPVTFAGVSLLLTLIAALATYVPARRASRLEPILALR
jgi:predicted permease